MPPMFGLVGGTASAIADSGAADDEHRCMRCWRRVIDGWTLNRVHKTRSSLIHAICDGAWVQGPFDIGRCAARWSRGPV